jgi:hypothetical protein
MTASYNVLLMIYRQSLITRKQEPHIFTVPDCFTQTHNRLYSENPPRTMTVRKNRSRVQVINRTKIVDLISLPHWSPLDIDACIPR